MLVKIQLLRDDGMVVVEHFGNAFHAIGRDFGPALPVVEGGQKLEGFCYLPVPPPPVPLDEAEYRRLVAEAFGG